MDAGDAGSTASARSDPPAPVCPPASTRCAAEASVERCADDGGGYAREDCAAGTRCIAGSCVTLGEPLATEPLLAVPTADETSDGIAAPGQSSGWLDAWSSHGPVPDATAAELAADPERAFAPAIAQRSKALCSPEGYVRVHRERHGGRRRPGTRLLAGHAIVGRDAHVWLKLGAAGLVRVYVHGALVADSNTNREALRDEVIVPLDLRAGDNPVLVTVSQQGDGATGLYLRIHDADNRVPVDFRWLPGHGRTCDAAELVQAHADLVPIAGGFDLHGQARVLGLYPESARPIDLALRYRHGSRRGSAPSDATAALLAGFTPHRGEVEATATLQFDKPERGAVVLELGGATGASREVAELASVHYRGKLHERVAALRGFRPPANWNLSSRASFEASLAVVLRAIAEAHKDTAWIDARTTDLESIVEASAGGSDPYGSRTGLVFRAYRSRLDGRLQSYPLYVPKRYDPDGPPLPLVLVAHGLGQEPTLALRYVFGFLLGKEDDRAHAGRHLPALPDLGAFVAAPLGYGDAGARALGEDDVLAVIDDIEAAYGIDDARVSLTGYSLGGTVAFVVPLHYPDRFAAAAPLCGYPNLLSYQSVQGTPKTPWEEVLLEKRYIRNYAENGAWLPLHIVHGGKDGPARSAVIADRYEELGYRHLFDVQNDLDHHAEDYAYKDARMLTWLTARRRPESPPHVHLRTGEYRYHTAYWLGLDAMRDPGRFADIDASFDPDAQRYVVKTDNVDAFTIEAPAFTAHTVAIDGATLPVDSASGMHFVREGNGFALAGTPPDRSAKKRPGVSGPLDDVLRHAFVVVYGTADPSQTESNRITAEHHASFDSWSGAHFPVRADRDVGETDIAATSLVLVGGPKSNRITAALVDSLPVHFEDGAITLRGERFAGEDVGVSFICPHPRNAAEYVVVHAGVGYRGTLASRHLPRQAPDFLVYDGRITRALGGELLGSERPVLAGGFFDDNWR